MLTYAIDDEGVPAADAHPEQRTGGDGVVYGRLPRRKQDDRLLCFQICSGWIPRSSLHGTAGRIHYKGVEEYTQN